MSKPRIETPFQHRCSQLLSGVAIAGLTAFVIAGCERSAPAPDPVQGTPASAQATTSGAVTIEFIVEGKPVETHAIDDVASGTTLETVLRGLKSPKMEMGGSGTTAFVDSIAGIRTSASRGWTFTIDDEFAKQGIGTTKLSPPTTIRWKFTSFHEAMNPVEKKDSDPQVDDSETIGK